MSLLAFLSSRRGWPLAVLSTLAALASAFYRLAPRDLPKLPPQIDIGVVVLLVPDCALTLAVMVEVLHRLWGGPLPEDVTPMARAIPLWQDRND